MPIKVDEEISRIHICPFTEDLEILKSLFSDNIGVSPAIRKIIRLWIENNNVKLGQKSLGIKNVI